MNKITKLLIGLICVSLGLTACKDDYFDQEKYDQRLKDYFPVGAVDPNHTWAVYGSAEAIVSVGGNSGEKYRVAIYQENPMNTSPVTLLSTAAVESGQQPVKMRFSYKLAQPTVYVACFDENNRRVVEAVTASDGGSININFFGAAQNSARSFVPFGRSTTRSVRMQGNTEWLKLNGSMESSSEGFFTITGDFNNKFTGASFYDAYFNSQLSFGSGLKINSSGSVSFAIDNWATVTIVQSDWQDNDNPHGTPHSLKFDNVEQSVSSAGWGGNCRIYTIAGVPSGRHVITRGNGESGIFFVKVEQYTLSEITIDPTTFAHTANDYLNPSGGMVATTSVVNSITEAQMKNYEAFTNDLIDDNNHHIKLDGATWTETIGGGNSGGESSTVSINGNSIFCITAGDNPGNGDSRNVIYGDGNTITATIQFGGTGDAAVAATRYSNDVTYSAKITRPYYLFTPLVDGQNQINLEIDDTYNGQKNFVVFDQTANSQVSSTQYYGSSLYIGGLQSNHTYRLSLADNTPLAFYGLKMYSQGTVTTGGGATEPTVIVHTNPGDGHHYRVASGTEITKPIAVNANFTNSQDTIYNDQVIYVEGKLNLYSNGTLNGPTIVVANGGELAVHGTVNGSNAARIVILPGGTISGDKDAVLNLNNGTPCYNAGTIDFEGTLNANGCIFYNAGTIDVDQFICTSTGIVTNYGTITAKNNKDAADAYNCKIVNACYMHFTEHAGIGQLFMLPSSRLDVDGYCEFSQSWQDFNNVHSPNILCNNSVVNVQTAYVTNTMFQGPMNSGEFAIVKMNNVQVGNGDDIHQSMNCYFDWDITEVYNKYGGRGVCDSGHKITGENPASANQVLKTHITKFVNEATAPASMSIPSGECTGAGYNTTPNTVVEDVNSTPSSYRFCFEDMYPSPGDYDFNDCVITVTPSVNGRVATVSVSLDAVGATKQNAAAMRIVGLSPDAVLSASCDYDDPSSKTNLSLIQLVTPCLTDKGENVRYVNPQDLGKNEDGSQITDFVVRLFNDAHLVISGNDYYDQYTHNCLYNTEYPNSERTLQYRTDIKDPVVMTFVFILDTEANAQIFNDATKLDVFIVEENTNYKWEVHTYPFKFDQVLNAWAEYTTKLVSYQNSSTRNYPWAIQVPSSFLYPIEYQSICGGTKIQEEDEEQFGYGAETYPYFRSWAINHESSIYEVQHWYDYISDMNLVWQLPVTE